MNTNPFKEKPIKMLDTFNSWSELYPRAYDKNETDPYTKCRIILMNGTEYEQVWFGHHSSRMCCNNDERRDLALLRRSEQLQQKTLANLKPTNETILETTIGFEQLAVDLTAFLAKNEKDPNVKQTLDFALLEDFDHLYRYANLLDLEHKIKAEKLVGKYTEVMPARPTIAHHRHPIDEIRKAVPNTSDFCTKLHTHIITAAEQQTMNYYMNVGGFYPTDIGRKLYMEIGMVEEQHVTEYGSLIDTTCSMLENLLMHEYVECYLYYSCYMTETDKYIKGIWERHYMEEVAHLHFAKDMLQNYENKDYQQVIPCGDFPAPVVLESNIDYVRDILDNTVNITADNEDYAKVCDLTNDSNFFVFQNKINGKIDKVPSHMIIDDYIKAKKHDYRYEIAPNPIEELQDNKHDNTDVGRSQKLNNHNTFINKM